ncbi:hypothetical protein KDA11_04740, partial [Candidatus Saccharibacteria bacterium]|nr:hypothetical protein [Candidatus Saccharibacteria bacterium]
ALKKLAYRSALHYGHNAIDSCCWLLLIDKAVLDTHRVRFTEGIIIMQDTWFYVDLLRNVNSLYSDDTITYNYMINANGTVSSGSKFAEKVDSIVKLYKYVTTVWDDAASKRQLKTQYYILIAIRTINSSTMSLKKVRELLKIISHYDRFFESADMGDVSFRHKTYVYAVRHNSPMLVLALALIRRLAILVKG